MGQLFRPRADRIFRGLLLGLAAAVIGGAVLVYGLVRSDWAWDVGSPVAQPIAFRHDLHAGTLGLDCRFCHSTVDRGAAAGMPSTETCLGCHREVLAGVRALEPLRTSAAFETPIAWGRIHDLPAYAYFHHGVHLAAGVACESCHGRVDAMTEIVKTETMSMGWCLDCHRDPAPRLRPPAAVFEMGWSGDTGTPPGHLFIGLTDCSTCHR